MTDPLPTSACPDCGAPLPPESPQSLCPAFLMRQALASRTVARDGDKAPHLSPPSPEEIADRFPGYEILESLGRGGMGAVYKARQKSLNRLVAIKILAPERVGEGRFAERFTIEAELLAKLGHPHIVTIHDFGETGGLFYLVMEFIDGVNLRDLLRDGKLEPQQALAIVPPICDALQYAHDKGIVHRDIKPENILLDRDGRVKIADFGIASLVGATGENSGTPPYMAPEQSGGTVDRRADIYALGVVLYEMLTGERPEKDLVAPSRKVSIDVRIDEIVLQALEKNPELRYQQASVMKTRLETIADPWKISGVTSETESKSPSVPLRDTAIRWILHLIWAASASGLVTLWITFISEILTTNRGNLDHSLMTWEDVYGPVIMVLIGGSLLALPIRKFRFASPRIWIGAVFVTVTITAIAYVLAAPVEDRSFHSTNFIVAVGVCALGTSLFGFAAVFGKLTSDKNNIPKVRLDDREKTLSQPTRFRWRIALSICLAFAAVVIGPRLVNDYLVRRAGAPIPEQLARQAITPHLEAKSLRWESMRFEPNTVAPSDILVKFTKLRRVGSFPEKELIEPLEGILNLRTLDGNLWQATGLGGLAGLQFKFSLASDSPTASVEILKREGQFGATRLEWQIKSDRATCFTAGWYAVEGDRLVEYQDLGNPVEPSAAPFKLVLEHHKENDQLKLSIGYGSGTGVSGTREAPGSNFRSGSMTNPTTLVADRYTELWRGECFDQDSEGRRTVLRTYVFVARLLGPDEASRVSQFGEDVRSGRLAEQLGLERERRTGNYQGLSEEAVELGGLSDGEPVEPPPVSRLVISKDRGGQLSPDGVTYSLDGEVVAMENLQERFQQMVKEHPELQVIVYANDPELPAGRAIIAMQAARAAGVKHVRIDTGEAYGEEPADAGRGADQSLATYEWEEFDAKGELTDGVVEKIDGRIALKIENLQNGPPLQARLLTIENPPIKGKRYAIKGEIRCENVQGAAYLEMWSDFPRGRFYTHTLNGPGSVPMAQITGTSDWRPFILPSDQARIATPPNRIEVNFHLPGRGVVFVGPLELVELGKEQVAEMEQSKREELDENPKPQDGEVAEMAEAWLSKIDAGEYEKSWKEAAEFFQKSIMAEAWAEVAKKFREPLGELKSRKFRDSQKADALPGAPDGKYVIMQFDTSFTTKAEAVETVTFILEKDGSWKAAGYLIR